jgi:hypothetical protein
MILNNEWERKEVTLEAWGRQDALKQVWKWELTEGYNDRVQWRVRVPQKGSDFLISSPIISFSKGIYSMELVKN